MNPTVRKLILNEEDIKLAQAIRLGKEEGMVDFTESLRQLVVDEKVERAVAFEVAPNPESLRWPSRASLCRSRASCDRGPVDSGRWVLDRPDRTGRREVWTVAQPSMPVSSRCRSVRMSRRSDSLRRRDRSPWRSSASAAAPRPPSGPGLLLAQSSAIAGTAGRACT